MIRAKVAKDPALPGTSNLCKHETIAYKLINPKSNVISLVEISQWTILNGIAIHAQLLQGLSLVDTH